ncbi:MAG: AIR synthase related protein, partial [Dehalococcoidia bacterium]
MEVGKLLAQLLARLLAQVTTRDPRVVVGPKLGEDAAVIDVGDKYLVAKTDPITFATDHIGWYAVHVNANDIAVMGARPAWFLATILLPQSVPQLTAEAIFQQILSACEQLDVELVGGHTEVTYGLSRPMVVGAMLGEVAKDRLVQSSGAQPGDRLLLTKGIAIEGTAILARELSEPLRQRGVAPDLIQSAQRLIFEPGISVVPEALLAAAGGRVHAMHDPTEGGLATAVH